LVTVFIGKSAWLIGRGRKIRKSVEKREKEISGRLGIKWLLEFVNVIFLTFGNKNKTKFKFGKTNSFLFSAKMVVRFRLILFQLT
jgi:hypothetical protein